MGDSSFPRCVDYSPSEFSKWNMRGQQYVKQANALGDSKSLLEQYRAISGQENGEIRSSQPDESPDRAYKKKVELLREALRCFNKAEKANKDARERTITHRNIALVISELAQLKDEAGDDSGLNDYKEAIGHWSRALKFGSLAGCAERWLEQVRGGYANSVARFVERCRCRGLPASVSQLEDVARSVDDAETKHELLVEICRLLADASSEELEQRQYTAALAHAEEGLDHLREAELLSQDVDDQTAVAEIKTRTLKVKAQASGMQMIQKADSMLKEARAIKDQPEDKTAPLIHVIDLYTQAILVSEDINFDTAAEACNRLRAIYKTELGDEDCAAYYYEQSMKLAAESRGQQAAAVLD